MIYGTISSQKNILTGGEEILEIGLKTAMRGITTFKNYTFLLQASVPLFMKYFECSKIEAEKYISSTVSLARDAGEEFWQKYQ